MQFRKGDLTEAAENVIVHGCNNRGVMGSGVALAIRKKWPEAYEAYRTAFEDKSDYNLLGNWTYLQNLDDNKFIVNLITQDGYGKDGKKYAYYISIVEGLIDIANWQRYFSNNKIAIPKIGCGLGGLDWNIMEVLLCEIEERYKVEFIVYEL